MNQDTIGAIGNFFDSLIYPGLANPQNCEGQQGHKKCYRHVCGAPPVRKPGRVMG